MVKHFCNVQKGLGFKFCLCFGLLAGEKLCSKLLWATPTLCREMFSASVVIKISSSSLISASYSDPYADHYRPLPRCSSPVGYHVFDTISSRPPPPPPPPSTPSFINLSACSSLHRSSTCLLFGPKNWMDDTRCLLSIKLYVARTVLIVSSISI